jgi:DNA-binding transcriptional LysR family regulator
MQIERVRRRVRLRDLETLVAVVQAGGMRKAAAVLNLSQPAVSKAVAELEGAIGLKLLERGRRGVEPTRYGMALVRRSEVLVDQLRGALRELADLADPEGGEVRLGAMETLYAGLVGATVSAMLQRHPGMRFVLESGQSPDLIHHFLLKRMVDFVVARPLSMPLPPGVEGEPLFCDRLFVVVGKTHPLARRHKLALAELADEGWILSRNELMPESPVALAFAAAGLESPRRTVTSGSLNSRYSLLETGRFATCIPHSLLPFSRERKGFSILPLELPAWHTATMILTLKGRALSPAAELFLEKLRELASPFIDTSSSRTSPAGR